MKKCGACATGCLILPGIITPTNCAYTAQCQDKLLLLLCYVVMFDLRHRSRPIRNGTPNISVLWDNDTRWEQDKHRMSPAAAAIGTAAATAN